MAAKTELEREIDADLQRQHPQREFSMINAVLNSEDPTRATGTAETTERVVPNEGPIAYRERRTVKLRKTRGRWVLIADYPAPRDENGEWK